MISVFTPQCGKISLTNVMPFIFYGKNKEKKIAKKSFENKSKYELYFWLLL